MKIVIDTNVVISGIFFIIQPKRGEGTLLTNWTENPFFADKSPDLVDFVDKMP